VRQEEALGILQETGAIITDSHIVYTSGKHGSMYINKDAVYPHPAKTSRLCLGIAEAFIGDGIKAVAAPAVGGTILSQWIAYHLSELLGREVLAVYAEREGPPARGFVFKRGYETLIPGKRILVVEDVLNTGGSAGAVVAAVRALGGHVIGLGALCNRGGIQPHDVGDVPRLSALVDIRLDAWDPASCPLCGHVPINTQIGKGREYLTRHPEYQPQ
jgi:orotate phosphoribosyltransferase